MNLHLLHGAEPSFALSGGSWNGREQVKKTEHIWAGVSVPPIYFNPYQGFKFALLIQLCLKKGPLVGDILHRNIGRNEYFSEVMSEGLNLMVAKV